MFFSAAKVKKGLFLKKNEDSHWLSLVVIDGNWWSLVVIDGHLWSLMVIGGH